MGCEGEQSRHKTQKIDSLETFYNFLGPTRMPLPLRVTVPIAMTVALPSHAAASVPEDVPRAAPD